MQSDPSQPTAWIVEGLLYYLDETQATTLMQTLDKLSAEGSSLCIDLINSKEREACSFRSSVDNPEDWIAAGWTGSHSSSPSPNNTWETDVVLQPGDEGANYGRFLRPFPPRLGRPGSSQEEVRRAFLVIARKK